MFGSAHGAMSPAPQSRGSGSLSTVSATSMSGEHSTTTRLIDHIPRCPCSWYIEQFHDRVVHVLEEFMLKAGATKARDLPLEVRRIRSGGSRDQPEDLLWLDFMGGLYTVILLFMCRSQALARTLVSLRYALASHSWAVLHWELSRANSVRTFVLSLYLARLRFNRPVTMVPSLFRMEAGWRIWRFRWLIAWQFW
jgi:hypothetical protein